MTKTAIQVIDRAAALLDALGRAGGDASLKVLSAETGLHPSTASRILASLMAHGLVERFVAIQDRAYADIRHMRALAEVVPLLGLS